MYWLGYLQAVAAGLDVTTVDLASALSAATPT